MTTVRQNMYNQKWTGCLTITETLIRNIYQPTWKPSGCTTGLCACTRSKTGPDREIED